jgi:hypothetical protein
MTEEGRRAFMAGRQLGKSVGFSAQDMVRAMPMSRPLGPTVLLDGEIHQVRNHEELNGLLREGGELIPARGLTQEEINSAEVVDPVLQARQQYSDEEFDGLFRDYVNPGRGQPTPTFEEQQQVERHSILSPPEELPQEDPNETYLRIRRIREIEHRRARGLASIPLAVEGYSIQPHETLEQFANRAHIAYEVDPDELRTRAWEDTHVLNSPFGTMTPEQIRFVQWLFQHWSEMTEQQQNWFLDQVAIARVRREQPIDQTASGIGTEIHRRIEAAVREAIQGYVGQPGNRTQMRRAVEQAVIESTELFNNRGLVREAFERMVDQIDLVGAMQQAFPEDEPIAPIDFGDILRGTVRLSRRD